MAATRVVHIPCPPELDVGVVVRHARQLLETSGFACVAATDRLERFDRRRHSAMFVRTAGEASSACDLVRRLARSGGRAHLVIDLRPTPGGPSRPAAIAHVRERSPAYRRSITENAGEDDAGARDVRLSRALSSLARRRGAAGERWLRAAVESARRRGDDLAAGRAAQLLSRTLTRRNAWSEARRLMRSVDAHMQRWAARVATGTELARIAVAMGELSAAESLLAGLAAEARVRSGEVPAAIRLGRAETLFWQGRFEEAATHLPPGRSSASEGLLVAGLVAWAMADAEVLAQLVHGGADAMAGDTRASQEDVVDALGGLLDSLGGPRRWTAIASDVGAGEARGERKDLGPLLRACHAEALLAAGRSEDARVLLGDPGAHGSEAALYVALLTRLRAAATGPGGATASLREFVARTGARGLERWGMRRTGVHLLHAVPALLQIVHDAEDEHAALSSACAWVRQQARADGAALVATDQAPRLVAGEGLTEADVSRPVVHPLMSTEAVRVIGYGTEAWAVAPVRSLGTRIGLAVVRGSAELGGSLAEAASLLAALCAPALRARLDQLALATAGRTLAPDILGESPAIAAVREAIGRAAATNFPVVIEGESGTGKELVARALHRLSARRDRRMCAINCAALTDDLVEAELFGYARGAFTGAIGARPGIFEDAHGSSLLLDEVSELSPRGQAKLLRALQEREIRRLGENVPRPVDVRVLAATNRPLAEEVGQGRFREDLLFRLAVVRIQIPPLRARVEDIPRLALACWRRMLDEVNKHATLGPDALGALARHDWPGNVRELQNVIAGLALLAPVRGRVGERHVTQALAGRDAAATGRSVPLDVARRAFERDLVAAALARHAGRRLAAARELGLTRQGLSKAMKRLGVDDVRPDAVGVA